MSTVSAYQVSPYLLFVKDFWFPLAALIGGGFFVLRGCTNIIKSATKVDLLEGDIETLKRDISYIKGKVSAIERFLKNTFASAQPLPGLIQSRSPLRLTAKGKRILKESGFEKIYHQKKDEFLKLAREQDPKLKYEAQETAVNIMLELKENSILDPLKKYAFAKGENLMDVIRVCGLFLRDEIIKEFNLKE